MNRKSNLFKGLSLGVTSIMTFGFLTSISNVFASTGDFSSDFVAAAPYSYNQLTGGGAFDDRTTGKSTDVVESLEAGDFKSFDAVTFFHQIKIADAPTKSNDSPQTIEIDYSLIADGSGPFVSTQYSTYKIENTSTAGTPDDFMVTARIYDNQLGIDQTVELLAGELKNITLGAPAPANTEQPYVDASII